MSNEIDDGEEAVPNVPAEFAHLLTGIPAGLEIADIDVFEAGDKGDFFFQRFPADHPEPSSKGLSDWMLVRSAGKRAGKVVVISLKKIDREAVAARVYIEDKLRWIAEGVPPYSQTGSFKWQEKRIVGPSVSSCGSYDNVDVEAESHSAEMDRDEMSVDQMELSDDELLNETIDVFTDDGEIETVTGADVIDAMCDGLDKMNAQFDALFARLEETQSLAEASKN